MTLPMYITEGKPYRPQGVMWVELPSRLILGWTLFDPRVPGPSFADTLREAMRSPHAGPPRRPPRVRVADEALAAEARAALADAPGEATEVVVAPTPELDELVRLFAESLPEGDETASYLESGRVPPGAVEQLFRADRASRSWRGLTMTPEGIRLLRGGRSPWTGERVQRVATARSPPSASRASPRAA